MMPRRSPPKEHDDMKTEPETKKAAAETNSLTDETDPGLLEKAVNFYCGCLAEDGDAFGYLQERGLAKGGHT